MADSNRTEIQKKLCDNCPATISFSSTEGIDYKIQCDQCKCKFCNVDCAKDHFFNLHGQESCATCTRFDYPWTHTKCLDCKTLHCQTKCFIEHQYQHGMVLLQKGLEQMNEKDEWETTSFADSQPEEGPFKFRSTKFTHDNIPPAFKGSHLTLDQQAKKALDEMSWYSGPGK